MKLEYFLCSKYFPLIMTKVYFGDILSIRGYFNNSVISASVDLNHGIISAYTIFRSREMFQSNSDQSFYRFSSFHALKFHDFYLIFHEILRLPIALRGHQSTLTSPNIYRLKQSH